MSHFAVMVVGGDPEEQLAPYHEFECTGEDDQYVVDVDETDDMRKEYEAYEPKDKYPTFEKFMSDYHEYESLRPNEVKGDKHKYNYVEVDSECKVVKVITRTNPNDKWDWYQLGGRWSGSLLHKNGDLVDSAIKKDIDIKGMMDAAEIKGLDRFDRAMEAISGRDVPDFDDLLKIHEIDRAREVYHSHPVIQDLTKAKFYMWQGLDKECSGGDRELHAKKARKEALVMFAFLRDGQWHERGSMGSFACVSNEDEDWPSKFQSLWDAIPDDEAVSIYDCHI